MTKPAKAALAVVGAILSVLIGAGGFFAMSRFAHAGIYDPIPLILGVAACLGCLGITAECLLSEPEDDITAQMNEGEWNNSDLNS